MHASEAGRRSNISEAHGLAELGLEKIDGSFQSPSRKFAYFRSLGRGHAVGRGEKLCDDGDADAVRIKLSKRATGSVGFKQRARQCIDRYILAWNIVRAKHRHWMADHVAGAFGD